MEQMLIPAAFLAGKLTFVLFGIKAIGLLNLKITFMLVLMGYAAIVAKLAKIAKLMFLKKQVVYKVAAAKKKLLLLKGLHGGDDEEEDEYPMMPDILQPEDIRHPQPDLTPPRPTYGPPFVYNPTANRNQNQNHHNHHQNHNPIPLGPISTIMNIPLPNIDIRSPPNIDHHSSHEVHEPQQTYGVPSDLRRQDMTYSNRMNLGEPSRNVRHSMLEPNNPSMFIPSNHNPYYVSELELMQRTNHLPPNKQEHTYFERSVIAKNPSAHEPASRSMDPIRVEEIDGDDEEEEEY